MKCLTANHQSKSRPIFPGAFLVCHGELLGQLILRFFLSRYKGSVLSWIWAFVMPLFLLLVYYFCFGMVLNLRATAFHGNIPYVLYMFSGLAVFNMFSECVTVSAGALLNYPNYVKKGAFDLRVLPLASVGAGLIVGMIYLGIAVFAVCLFTGIASVRLLLLPVWLAAAVLTLSGISLIVSCVSVYIRDMPMLIGLMLQGIFFLSPVIYAPEQVPKHWRIFFELNPLTWFIESFRGMVVGGGRGILLEALLLLGGGVCWFAGTFFFLHFQRRMSDVL